MTHRDPQVLLVLPTYNRARLLHRAISALRAQTYGDFELRIYDNASTDDTAAVAAAACAADSRIRYHRHAENIGAYRNFAYGLQRVDRPYFALLSDDDVPLPRFLGLCVGALEQHPDAGFAACGTVEMTEAGTLIHAPQLLWEHEGRFCGADGVRRLLDGNHPSWNTILFRRSAADVVGLPNVELGLVFDLEFTLRVAARFPYVVTREPGGIFVRHEDSSTEFADAGVAKSYDAAIAVVETSWDAAPPVRRLVADGLRRMLQLRLTQIVVKAYMRGDTAAALAALNEIEARSGRSPLGRVLRAYASFANVGMARRSLRRAVGVFQSVTAWREMRTGARRGVAFDAAAVSSALRFGETAL